MRTSESALAEVNKVKEVFVDVCFSFEECANTIPLSQNRSKIANHSIILYGLENESLFKITGVKLIDDALNLIDGVIINQPIKIRLILPIEVCTFLSITLISFIFAMMIPAAIATQIKSYDILKMR